MNSAINQSINQSGHRSMQQSPNAQTFSMTKNNLALNFCSVNNEY